MISEHEQIVRKPGNHKILFIITAVVFACMLISVYFLRIASILLAPIFALVLYYSVEKFAEKRRSLIYYAHLDFLKHSEMQRKYFIALPQQMRKKVKKTAKKPKK